MIDKAFEFSVQINAPLGLRFSTSKIMAGSEGVSSEGSLFSRVPRALTGKDWSWLE